MCGVPTWDQDPFTFYSCRFFLDKSPNAALLFPWFQPKNLDRARFVHAVHYPGTLFQGSPKESDGPKVPFKSLWKYTLTA